MGLFNKIVNILFDEQEEEIPVITKSTEKNVDKTKKETAHDDEVIITKIEKNGNEEELFDMPKFKEEIKEEPNSEKSFNFPMIDDDDFSFIDEKRTSKNKDKEDKKEKRKFDFLSSTSYKKSDSYTSSRNNLYDDTDNKKPFTLSPIISPVYGILNENYKKEDIVTKNTYDRINNGGVDLDSVRKKAYGTLENEIEVSLNKTNDDILDEVPTHEEMTLEALSDDGLSIDDLLVDDKSNEVDIEDDNELFDIGNEEIEEEIEIEEKEEEEKISEDNDLFDLIDSIYAGKDEEGE